MKNLLVLAAVLLGGTAQAQTAVPEGCIQVEVHNVRPQQGQLMLAAYLDADSYGKKPVASVRVPAGEEITRVQICGLSGGQVAVTMFQDLDGDGKMNKNLVGMPTEPWGSSGTPGSFGPSWETGRVALDSKPVIVKLVK